MARRRSTDYVAELDTERPVSHHSYLYERMRSGDWIASVTRHGDGSHEDIEYFNVRTGASVWIRRNDVGEIVSATIEQRDDYSWDQREPTGEHATFLGEQCAVWRSRAHPPGAQMLYESCVTDDGVELWSQIQYTGHPAHPDYISGRVEVKSLRRGRVDPRLARPPREIFDEAYWRRRAATVDAQPSQDAPPEHSVWYGDNNSAGWGRVIQAQYWAGARSELLHNWYLRGDFWDYQFRAPGVAMRASFRQGMGGGERSLQISLSDSMQAYRHAPDSVERGASQTILGRQCTWLTPRAPMADASWRECWTDDGFVLGRVLEGRGERSSDIAVRLVMTPPLEPLAPLPEIFAWVRRLRG